MYRRNKTDAPSAPPPGYGGTAFAEPAWPPPSRTPERPRAVEKHGSFVPFVPAPQIAEVQPPPEEVPINAEEAPVSVVAELAPPVKEKSGLFPAFLAEDTLLLLGVLVLLWQGGTEPDLLAVLAVLCLL